jgi:WD40 repeat protein/GTPase SAR1 family protein
VSPRKVDLHSVSKILTDEDTLSPRKVGLHSVSKILTDEDTLNTKKVDGRSVSKKLEVLHAKMKMYLREDQRVEVSTHCSPEAYLKEKCKKYATEWERVTRDCLKKELQKVIDKSEQWNAGFAGIPVDHLEEIFHHCTIAFTKANSFFGRENLLRRAKEMVDRHNKAIQRTKEKKSFSGICLAVVGKSGCGKTALMAKLALSLFGSSATAKKIPMVIRFCGTSRYSLNGLKLIQSISLQILAVYERKDELKEFISVLPSQDYQTAVEYFHKLIFRYPVNLLIDSLDQLENRNEERSKLTFLRDLHEQSRVIVSTLPDEYEENGKPGKYYYECEKTLKSSSVPILDVGIIDEVEVTIKSLLASRNKRLTSDQLTVTLQAVSHEPTILYINLAMEVISQWRSFEKEVILTPTVKGLIHQIFGDLEVSYGKEFTAIAFAMISFSREGVNEPELQDLLSLNDEVMTEVCQYSKLHCFPMHMWLRLKQVIKNLVTDKENHCIKWYHRQLWETASERYSEKEKKCHEIMGKYFANRYDNVVKKDKDIMTQPLILNEVSVRLPESIVNKRRVMEGYYHLIKGGLLQETVEEVCSLEFVCCSALAGDLSNCIRYLGELIRLFGDKDIPQQLDHYYRWMRKKATRIVFHPRRQTRMTAGEEPLISVVKKQISQLEERERNELGHTLEPMTFNCLEDFDALELELVGHTDKVTSVVWNSDESKILSKSNDKTIKIWDGITGVLLNTLEGHSETVYSVAWNHDGSKIAAGYETGTIKVWDAVSCELLMTLKDNSQAIIRSVSWNHDSSKIASASDSGQAIIWDGTTGKPLHTLSGRRCSWNHDGSKLLSASEDKIKMWNAVTGELLKTLESHSREVTCASWSRDSSMIVSGSEDKTVKLWNGMTGVLLKTLEGHTASVHSVSWHYDGKKIFSRSDDDTIRIWDVLTGKLIHSIQSDGLSVLGNDGCRRIATGSRISRTGTIQVWDLPSFSKRKSEPHITCLSRWNSNGCKTIISGMEDGAIKIWDGMTGQLLRKLSCHHSGAVSAVEWNHDGTKLATGSSGESIIKIWDAVSSYELLMTLEGHSESVHSFSWNHDSSRLLAMSSECELFLWDGMTGDLLKRVKNSTGGFVRLISWNHESTEVATVHESPGKISIWDGAMTRERRLCAVDKVYSINWNGENTKIVSGSFDKFIRIWDVESGALLNTLTGHSKPVSVVFWNHDDSKLISASFDETVRIWDGTTGELLKIEWVGSSVRSMSLNKPGDRIIFHCHFDAFLRCWATTKLLEKSVEK